MAKKIKEAFNYRAPIRKEVDYLSVEAVTPADWNGDAGYIYIIDKNGSDNDLTVKQAKQFVKNLKAAIKVAEGDK